jgi:hypothetical protein
MCVVKDKQSNKREHQEFHEKRGAKHNFFVTDQSR